MMRTLVSLLSLVAVSTACVSTGELDPQGYTHKKVGYTLPYAQVDEKVFINRSWELEVNASGKPSYQHSSIQHIDSVSYSGYKQTIFVNGVDLAFKHRQTNGMIFVQSSPLEVDFADKKLPILAKDKVESMSGFYHVTEGSQKWGQKKNLVTNIVSSQAGKLGTAETYEVVVDVANAEQLKLNAEHRLFRSKMVFIQPKNPEGWKNMREELGKRSRSDQTMAEDTYPALIVLTYVMDHAFYDEYLRDFEGMFGRVKLRGN